MDFTFNPEESSDIPDLSDITLPGLVMPGTGIDTNLDFSGVDFQISRQNAESVGLIQDPEPTQATESDLPETPSTTPQTESGSIAVDEMTESEKAMASSSEKINIAIEEARAEAAKAEEEARIKAEKEAEEARKAEEQRQAEELERAKALERARKATKAKAKAEAEAEKESEESSSSSSSSSSMKYSQAVQEGLDSGKYKIDENGYVVAAGSSSTPRARR